jgi:hypothetical protein
MQIKTHNIEQQQIAELTDNNIIIHNPSEGGNLIGNLYFNGFDRVILYEHQLCSDFFDLKTKLAGEILQKISNYRMRLVIIGDFSKFSSNSLQQFISESNRGKTVNFVSTLHEALNKLSGI